MMESILEEFAYGNISPEIQRFSHNSPCGQAMGAVSSSEKKLFERLDKDEKALFEKFVEAQGEVNQLTAVKSLVRGFKLGLLMTAEVFLASGEFFDGEEIC